MTLVWSAVVAAALTGGAYAWQSKHTPASVDENYVLSMTDYGFAPAKMVWHVGDRVTITLVNDSEARPQKEHEFMVGRTPRTEETVFGLKQEDGFETPFFPGVAIDVIAGSGLKMLMAGDAKLTGLPPMKVMAPGPMGPMEEMTGFMPLLGPHATLTFSFVVPDRPGKWVYGCFEQSGQHFLNGMKGTITVLPKSA
jgi:plastocyanin